MWRLPEPGFLEGVKSKDKAILKMHGMAFQYPGTPKPQLTGVSLQVRSLSGLGLRAVGLGTAGLPAFGFRHGMAFQYPGTAKPQLTGVSLQVCVAFHFGVLGHLFVLVLLLSCFPSVHLGT